MLFIDFLPFTPSKNFMFYWSIVIATDHRIFASTSLLYVYCTYYSEQFLYSVGAARGSNYANLIGLHRQVISVGPLKSATDFMESRKVLAWSSPTDYFASSKSCTTCSDNLTTGRTNLIPRRRSAPPAPGYKIYLYRKYIFCHNCVTVIVSRRRCRTVKWVSHAVTGSQ